MTLKSMQKNAFEFVNYPSIQSFDKLRITQDERLYAKYKNKQHCETKAFLIIELTLFKDLSLIVSLY